MTVLALIFATGTTSFATAEKEYENWTQIADDMAVHIKVGVELYKNDDPAGARDSVNTAYFKYYEKLGFEKMTMKHISGERGAAVENTFFHLKKHFRDGNPAEEAEATAETLITMLHEDANALDGGNSKNADSNKGLSGAGIFTFLTAFGLILREGLEAILVIAAIVAYLVKTNNAKHCKVVYLGAILGIVASILLAIVFNIMATSIGEAQSGVSQEIFEGIGMFLAVIVLFYVSNWMISKAEAEVWSNYVQGMVESSITTGNRITLAFTAFLAVAREGAELIIFFQGLTSNKANSPMYLWAGIVVASIVLIFVYVAIQYFSVRLPLKPFFIGTSILMFVLCISFLGKGVYEFQEAGVIGRTFIPFMNGMTIDMLGIYDRVETLLPQIVLLAVTVVTVIVHLKRNEKLRKEFESENASN